ncbi:hypothetical protein AQJ27_44035 [Streptomyces olivochromogenes]|nr:hypothetical protein AQJ27_44035 [Streptomyces olivochromogenes]
MICCLESYFFSPRMVACLLQHPGQITQGERITRFGRLPVQRLGTRLISCLPPHPCQLHQGFSVSGIGSLPVIALSPCIVTISFALLAQLDESARVSLVRYVEGDGFGFHVISSSRPPAGQFLKCEKVPQSGCLTDEFFSACGIVGVIPEQGQLQDCGGAARVGRAVAEAVCPRETEADLGLLGKHAEVVGDSEVGAGSLPERGGRAQASAGSTAMLF